VIAALGAPRPSRFSGATSKSQDARTLEEDRSHTADRHLPPAYVLRQTGGELDAVKRLVWATSGDPHALDEIAAAAARSRPMRRASSLFANSATMGVVIRDAAPSGSRIRFARSALPIRTSCARLRPQALSLAKFTAPPTRMAQDVGEVTTLSKELRRRWRSAG